MAALDGRAGAGAAGLGRVEYVEEPLVRSAVTASGHRAMAAALTVEEGVSLPFALDESLVEGVLGAGTAVQAPPGPAGPAAVTPPWPAAVELNPAVLGGLSPTPRVAARWVPAAAVASTCFDGGIGLAWAALHAAALDAVARPPPGGEPPGNNGGGGGVGGGDAPAHGLGTFSSLPADVVVAPLAAAAWSAPAAALDVAACAELLDDVAATAPPSAGSRPPPPGRPPPRFSLSPACAVAVPTQLFPR